jgi:beta-mannosidase
LLTPLLWWPHNIGAPNLYNFSVSLTNGKDNIDQRNVTFGIRTVNLLYDIDEGKPSSMFAFEVNGFKIFAKGANYVPHNYFIT